MNTRVFLVGGSDSHKNELAAYGAEFGFEIVGHVRYRSKVTHSPKKGTFDKVASMVVYQSHQLSKFASDLAKKNGVPLVILAFGSKMNAMKIANMAVTKADEPVISAPQELTQAEALKYLGYPYHKCLTILRSKLVKSRNESNRVMYDKASLDSAIEALTSNQSLFQSLPEPYPRKKTYTTIRSMSGNAPQATLPAVQEVIEAAPEKSKEVKEAPVDTVVAPTPARPQYMLFQLVSGTDTFKLVPKFDNALLNGSTDPNDLSATIEIAADANDLPNKTVLLLVQPVLKSEVLRQVSLKSLPVY